MWTYQQSTGELSNAADQIVAHGYSGSPQGKNDSSKQSIVKVGPLPRGRYSIGAPFDSTEHGPYCLRLTPDPANQMFGRDGFLIHGDSIAHPGAASQGCIVVAHVIREMVWKSADHQLQVIQ